MSKYQLRDGHYVEIRLEITKDHAINQYYIVEAQISASCTTYDYKWFSGPYKTRNEAEKQKRKLIKEQKDD